MSSVKLDVGKREIASLATGGRTRTWKITRWDNPPEEKSTLPLTCDCGREAECPVGVSVAKHLIAIIGNGRMLIFDPPSFVPPANAMPDEIRCRRCGREFCREVDDVR
jgi:hypothetical protein